MNEKKIRTRPRRCFISRIPKDKTLPHHKGTMYVQAVPASTKSAFKSECAKRDISMRDCVILLMRLYALRPQVQKWIIELGEDEKFGSHART